MTKLRVVAVATVALACTDIVHLRINTHPEVVGTDPPASATDVDLDLPITVSFSEPIDLSDIAATIRVVVGSTSVAGTITGAGASALMFEANEPLEFSSSHDVEVTGVRDASGAGLVLESSHRWSFTTRDLVFSSAHQVSLSVPEPTFPVVSVASRNQAAAIWQRNDGARYDVLVSDYNGITWTPQTVIDTTTSDATGPDITIDGNGVMTAAWQEDIGGGCGAIWAARKGPGLRWDLPVRIESNACNLGGVRLSANASGVVVASWTQTNGTVSSGWANRYIPAQGWQTAGPIESDADSAEVTDVGMDDGGSAIVTYQTFDGTRQNVWSSRFVPGSGWFPVALESSTANARNPRIAVAPTGFAVVVWEQAEGAVADVMSSTFSPGLGWATSVFVEGDESGACFLPDVAVAPNGDAFAVWERADGGELDIESAVLPFGSSAWNPATKIETSAEIARRPRVAVDARGFAITAWRQFDGLRYSTLGARFAPSVGWGAGTPLEGEAGAVQAPECAMSEDGFGVVVWSQTTGAEDHVRVSRLR